MQINEYNKEYPSTNIGWCFMVGGVTMVFYGELVHSGVCQLLDKQRSTKIFNFLKIHL